LLQALYEIETNFASEDDISTWNEKRIIGAVK
jgi:hypothetical protein